MKSLTTDLRLPAGVRRIPTTRIQDRHTVLTEVLTGMVWKRLAITEPHAKLKRRMHRHMHRDDYIFLLSGEVALTVYDGHTLARIPVGARTDVIIVPRGIWHGYETGTDGAIIIEASSEVFDPTDVEDFIGGTFA